MFEQGSSDKVRFLALGELPPPGSCLICGSGVREEGYVDLGFYMDYVGEALVCFTCVIQIGEVIGMMHPAEVGTLKQLSANMAEIITGLKSELAVSNERLAAYDLTFRHFVDSHATEFDDSSDEGQPSLLESPIGSETRKRAPKKSPVSTGLGSVGETGPSDGESQESEPEGPLSI